MRTLAAPITIAGTGIYAPPKTLTNQYFDEYYGFPVSPFLEQTLNIKCRHWMDEDQVTSDLATAAVASALDSANLAAEDLDLLLVATDTPDYLSPSTATIVQRKLNAKKIGTFDLNSACAGFVTALDVAYRYLMTSRYLETAAVVGVYGMSRYLNAKDYKRATVFADGAGAVILKKDPSANSSGLRESILNTDGRFSEYMGIFAGGTALPLSHQVLEDGRQFLRFEKRIPPEFNTEAWPELVRALLDRSQLEMDQIKHFLFTQININSIRQSLANLSLDDNKTTYIMDRYGYTGSACIPMALHEARQAGHCKQGDNIVLVASGGGVSMAALCLNC